jgi:hypothetical protein
MGDGRAATAGQQTTTIEERYFLSGPFQDVIGRITEAMS